MTDIMDRLVICAMLGQIARKVMVLSEIDDHVQDVLNPGHSQPKPSRTEIKKDARRCYKKQVIKMNKGIS